MQSTHANGHLIAAARQQEAAAYADDKGRIMAKAVVVCSQCVVVRRVLQFVLARR
jgi:hypothetical protein